MLKLERYSLPAREEAGIIDLVMVFEKFISLSVVLLQGTLRGKKEKENRINKNVFSNSSLVIQVEKTSLIEKLTLIFIFNYSFSRERTPGKEIRKSGGTFLYNQLHHKIDENSNPQKSFIQQKLITQIKAP